MPRDHVLLHINGREHRANGAQVFTTLSNYLRYDYGATGTKIVCEEGDCGACTVLVRRRPDDHYQPVNSCILALGQLDGTSVVTVEGLRENGELSAVQEAMVSCHGAQCGYCTPGFVVAMTALFENCDRVDSTQVRDGLTGNLCRCTGYEPIIKAALAVDGSAMTKMKQRYSTLPDAAGDLLVEADGRTFFAPRSLEAAIEFKGSHPGCTIVQGGTDLGVWVNKRGFVAPVMLSLAKIEELDVCEGGEVEQATAGAPQLSRAPQSLTVGANVSLTGFEEAIRQSIPELHQILRVFGSPQIRNAGTLVGNIANGSPIGDTLPYLFVTEAELILVGRGGKRIVPITSFYRGYKTFDLAADEIITAVRVPLVANGDLLKLYKVSRRRDLDISAFTAAVRLRVRENEIQEARIAYGGVAPVVLRLTKTEDFLAGRSVTLETFEEASRLAITEIAPISDVRGSKDYRMRLAENILVKFYWDAFGGAAGLGRSNRGLTAQPPVQP